MSDNLISRQVAIDALRNELKCVLRKDCDRAVCKTCDLVMNEADIIEALTMAIDVLSAQPEQQWIPCDERLPEAGEYIGDIAKYYLVQNEYGDMMVARYTHSEYWEQIYQLEPIGDKIVAWMPLPQPYKESENEK